MLARLVKLNIFSWCLIRLVRDSIFPEGPSFVSFRTLPRCGRATHAGNSNGLPAPGPGQTRPRQMRVRRRRRVKRHNDTQITSPPTLRSVIERLDGQLEKSFHSSSSGRPRPVATAINPLISSPGNREEKDAEEGRRKTRRTMGGKRRCRT